MDPRDLAHREHRALDEAEHDALLAGQVLRQVRRTGMVVARLEQDDHGEAGGLARQQAPARVAPQVLGVGLGARLTVDAVLALDPRLGLRRAQGLRAQVALERP